MLGRVAVVLYASGMRLSRTFITFPSRDIAVGVERRLRGTGGKMKLINPDKLREEMYHNAFETDTELQKWDSGCWIRYKLFENILDAQPIVDAPERKKGKWIIYVISMLDGEGCRCSECGFEGAPYWDYCPNCGADMREESDNERTDQRI